MDQAGVESRDVRAIGSHGQTVWHQPDGVRPVSIQLGNPSFISRNTGIITVADFRKADIRAGGQGAPLAPLLHRQLFRDDDEMRAIRIKQGNLIGPAGFISMEDGEAVEIVQKAVVRDQDKTSYIAMGGGVAEDAEHLVTESAIVGFWDHYRALMGIKT